VVGSASLDPSEEVLLLADAHGQPELLVCAVPYLRDRDLRVAEAGESIEDKERKLLEGIRCHYAAVTELAVAQRRKLKASIPIIGMGHLFTAGGQTVEDEGLRDLYVGSLARVTADIFPKSLDYLALGHLHIPQKVSTSETMRYSGAPLAMSFSEANQRKTICLLSFAPKAPDSEDSEQTSKMPQVQLLPVPAFQQLERVRGHWEMIASRLRVLAAAGSAAWLEIVYEGEELLGDLRERLDAAIEGTDVDILRVHNKRIMQQVLSQQHEEETLDTLHVNEVFARCLQQYNIPEEQRPSLLQAYQEIIVALHEEDRYAQ
jgi:exonuclease SbcD